MKYTTFAIIILGAIFLVAYQVLSMEDANQTKPSMGMHPQNTRVAVFAGGCFWCTESDFEKVSGVIEAISGYTGGHVTNPTYAQVSAGGTGHVEAVKVIYDPAKIDYDGLLEIFWRSIDPTDPGGQFVDRGPQYRSAIFYVDKQQQALAVASAKRLAASGVFDQPIVTEILPFEVFYEAEDYHQDYYKKNPIRYNWYRSGSGRDRFLEKIWADRPLKMKGKKMNTHDRHMQGESTSGPGYLKPDDTELRKRLTQLQYNVTQKGATERPFQNAYWDNHEMGIYVDIVSGEELFSSTDKFDSGTGWPSFTRPLEPENIVEKTDRSFFMVRTEVISKNAGSHLGHVFNDGPAPTGLRYCINSAALRFIPKKDLAKEGYGEYAALFEEVPRLTVKEAQP